MPKPAPTMTATMIPTNKAPTPRRSGDCAGSVSRITSAESTRWVRNWYDWSWSRRDATCPPRPSADGCEHAPDGVEDSGNPAGQRDQRHDDQDIDDVGEPADVRRRCPPARGQPADPDQRRGPPDGA